MIVAAIVIGALPAVVTRLRRGCAVTPDGFQYARMGRGEKAPRPYAMRTVAKFINPTTEAWTVVTSAGLIVSLVAMYVIVVHFTGNAWAGVGACGLWGALPYTRRLLVWPALLDGLSIAVTGLIGLSAFYGFSPLGFAGLTLLVIASQYVHERAMVHGALLACFIMGSWYPLAALFVGLVVYYWRYHLTDSHPDEDAIDYLAQPMQTAVASHRKVGISYAHWVLPWGVFAVGIVSGSWFLIACVVASYLPLLVSVDKVRTYQANPYPLVIATMAVLPIEWWLPAYVFHLTISDGVV